EHDVALKCFSRAIQIDPEFTYAHTLSGHEYVSLDDSDKAMLSFRAAIRCDKRHYNAWQVAFGIGTIYLRQQKHPLAHFHLSHAYTLNPNNPVLLCHLAHLYEKTANPQKALQLYTQACTLRPDIPLYAYRLASLLHAQGKDGDALEVVEGLVGRDGVESAVQFLYGKCLVAVGEWERGMRAFTVAQDGAAGKGVEVVRGEVERLVQARGGEGEF
ncbi:hypothetical protein HDU98_005157, partial [Podochytrium sp. JEL0797]